MTLTWMTPAQKAAIEAASIPDQTDELEKEADLARILASATVKPLLSATKPLRSLNDWDDFDDCTSRRKEQQQQQQQQQRGISLSPLSSSPPPPPPPSQLPTSATLQVKEQGTTSHADEKANTQMEKLELPLQDDIYVVKKFFEQVAIERTFSRPQANSSNEFELECIGAVGRDRNDKVRLCIKWKGYPWSEATWSLLEDVPWPVKDNLAGTSSSLGDEEEARMG